MVWPSIFTVCCVIAAAGFSSAACGFGPWCVSAAKQLAPSVSPETPMAAKSAIRVFFMAVTSIGRLCCDLDLRNSRRLDARALERALQGRHFGRYEMVVLEQCCIQFLPDDLVGLQHRRIRRHVVAERCHRGKPGQLAVSAEQSMQHILPYVVLNCRVEDLLFDVLQSRIHTARPPHSLVIAAR